MEADRTSLDKLANVMHLQVGAITAFRMALIRGLENAVFHAPRGESGDLGKIKETCLRLHKGSCDKI